MGPLVNESRVEENFRKLTMEEKQVVNKTIAKFNKRVSKKDQSLIWMN